MITDIADALYVELARILVDEECPPLVDGEIVLGREHVLEASSPPRIIMIPVRSIFGPQGETATTADLGQNDAWLARSLLTDAQHFEVVVWAAASPPNPRQDFNATERLYKLFLRAIHRVSHGAYVLSDGEWLDQRPEATQVVKLGHQFTFGVAFETPVQDDSLAFVPIGTDEEFTTTLESEAP